ncbi:hypothetical protein ACFQE1_11980, partial [Halobium palmae]
MVVVFSVVVVVVSSVVVVVVSSVVVVVVSSVVVVVAFSVVVVVVVVVFSSEESSDPLSSESSELSDPLSFELSLSSLSFELSLSSFESSLLSLSFELSLSSLSLLSFESSESFESSDPLSSDPSSFEPPPSSEFEFESESDSEESACVVELVEPSVVAVAFVEFVELSVVTASPLAVAEPVAVLPERFESVTLAADPLAPSGASFPPNMLMPATPAAATSTTTTARAAAASKYAPRDPSNILVVASVRTIVISVVRYDYVNEKMSDVCLPTTVIRRILILSKRGPSTPEKRFRSRLMRVPWAERRETVLHPPVASPVCTSTWGTSSRPDRAWTATRSTASTSAWPTHTRRSPRAAR